MRLLLFYYSFISFSRKAKTSLIGTIFRLCRKLFLVTCQLNNWLHGIMDLEKTKFLYYLYERLQQSLGYICHGMQIVHIYTVTYVTHTHSLTTRWEFKARHLTPQCSVVVYTLNICYYIFYREYLLERWVTDHLCKRVKRAMSRLKNQVCEKSKNGSRWLQNWAESYHH